ncbi:MAG: U32 family peptidase [Ruminococcaceae bacterium]|nr:U32 family peptidase [Oscillospiraceae bacterium]
MRPEILSPAGDFEKLKSAVYFGADAVYLAGSHFGMRAASGNFTNEELREAVNYCHERGVKLYVTVNIMPRDGEYEALREFLCYLEEIKVDAAIVSDLGVATLLRECAPSVPLHVSTQASVVSAAACRAWYALGATRVVLARELSLEAVKKICRDIPKDLEIECFVHGSMCIAYSGRCLLSQHYVGRDANRGACAQPCRWIYNSKSALLLDVAEEKRSDELLPIVEDGGDSFIMSSKDMCMIEHIPELCDAGIHSFKLEGRVRSAYYTAVVTNTYKMALDRYLADPEGYEYDPALLRELESVSHREYGTGFFLKSPHEDANIVSEPGYIREKAYIATAVTDSDGEGYATFIQRNKLCDGASVELLTPGKTGQPFYAKGIWNEKGEAIESAPHPGMLFKLKVPFPVHTGDILRGGE